MDVAQWTNYIVFTTEGLFEVATESWNEWDSNPRPLNSVQTLEPIEPSSHEFNSHSFTDTDDSQDTRGKVGDHPMFQFTTSTRSQIFRHLFATLHVRWLSHIFNRTVCIYQAATWWESPSYRITIWLIDDVKLIFVCLLFVLILGFCYSFLTRETSGLELIWAIILVLQVNQPIKP